MYLYRVILFGICYYFRQKEALFLINVSILDGDVEHGISTPVAVVQNSSANDRRSGAHHLDLTIVRFTGEYRMSVWTPVVSVAPLETESTSESNGKVSFTVKYLFFLKRLSVRSFY